MSTVYCPLPACRHALKGPDVFMRHMIYDYLNKVVTCPQRTACGLCDVVFYWRFADMYSRMWISQVTVVCVRVCFPGTTVSTVPWPNRTLSSGTLECWPSSWSGWSWRRARSWTAVIIVWARWETFVQMKSVILKRGIHQFGVFFLSWPKWFVWGYLFLWQAKNVSLSLGGNWVSNVSIHVHAMQFLKEFMLIY